jgi:uncharacterized membrane protein YfcA
MHAFEVFIAEHGLWAVFAAAAVMFAGGLVKGAVGFALPLISVSGLGSFLPAQLAVAIMMLSMLSANLWQAGREGVAPAIAITRRFWIMIAVLMPMILLFSQFLPLIPERLFFGVLGVGVTVFSGVQLMGWRPQWARRAPRLSQVIVGLVGGLFGGLAGIWGPPVTLYLVSADIDKRDTMLALGIVFGVGSLVLTAGSIASGVLNAQTTPLSLAAMAPVMLGMGVGFWLHDRLDAAAFRRWTLLVLVLTGLNLIRRAVML